MLNANSQINWSPFKKMKRQKNNNNDKILKHIDCINCVLNYFLWNVKWKQTCLHKSIKNQARY